MFLKKNHAKLSQVLASHDLLLKEKKRENKSNKHYTYKNCSVMTNYKLNFDVSPHRDKHSSGTGWNRNRWIREPISLKSGNREPN